MSALVQVPRSQGDVGHSNCSSAYIVFSGICLLCRVRAPEFDYRKDAFRYGSAMEMLREVVRDLCEDGKRCRLLIQPSLGVGFLKVLGNSVLDSFCSALFCFVLFILFCSILFYSIPFRSVLF